MSVLQRAQASVIIRSSWSGPLTSSSPELARLWASTPVSSGVAVNEHTALNYAAVWSAVTVISSHVASLPLHLYKRLPGGGKERATGHPLYRLLHDEPNPEMSSVVLRETLQAHLLTWGNAYAEIERNGLGRPTALWPLEPSRVYPERNNRQLQYRITNPSGKDSILAPIDVIHVPGLGFDGTVGYSVISKARESIGLGMATERFGGSFFGNGSSFGGVLTHPGKVTQLMKDNIRESVDKQHTGVERANRFLILGEGMKYDRLGIPPNDAQFLETRKFQVAEICRWFNIPPHKLKDLERATFSNIEQQSIEFVTDTLRPWLVRWEQELNRKLIAPLERGIQFTEHLVDGLLRGDIQSRYQAYAVGRQWGWLSADDVLEKENMNPLPNGQGKLYLVPQNMAPADRINDIIDKQTEPTPTPVVAAPAEAEGEAAAARERATRAEAAAAEAHQQYEQEREARIALEATGTATAEELTRRRASEAAALAHAQQVTDLHAELVARAEQLRAALDAAKADAIAAHERAREASDAKALADAHASAAIAKAQQATDSNTELVARAEQLHASLDAAKADAIAADERAREAIDAKALADAKVRDAIARLEDTDNARRSAEQRADHLATEAETATGALRKTLEQARDEVIAERDQAVAAGTAASEALADAVTRAQVAEAECSRLAAKAEEAIEKLAAVERTKEHETAAHQAQVSRAARLERELEALQRADGDRAAAYLAAERALFTDIMRRMIERECDRARRAQVTPEKFRAFLQTFYDGHEELCQKALIDAVRLHLIWIRSDHDPEDVTRRIVAQHVETSQRQLQAVLDGDADELSTSLAALLHRWERDRPQIIADRMLQEGLEYARR